MSDRRPTVGTSQTRNRKSKNGWERDLLPNTRDVAGVPIPLLRLRVAPLVDRFVEGCLVGAHACALSGPSSKAVNSIMRLGDATFGRDADRPRRDANSQNGVSGGNRQRQHDNTAFVSVAEQLHVLRCALTELETDALPPSELRVILTEVAALRNQVEALEVAVIQQVDRSSQWAVDGSRSLRAWVANNTSSSNGTASRKIAAEKLLEDAPGIAAALAAGQTTMEHVAILARAIGTNDARRDALPAVEAVFAELATKVRPHDFAKAVSVWVHHVDALSDADDHSKKKDRAYLRASLGFENTVVIDAVLDPETGQAFLAALDAAREFVFRQGGDEPGPEAAATGQPRRPPRSTQNVAALRHLLDLAAMNPAMPMATGGLPVHVVVTTSLDSLRSQLTDAGIDPATLGNSTTGAATGTASRHIPAATARRLACDASIIPIVLNGKSQVLDVGRRTRAIHPALRLAIEVRDQHCRSPGCDANIQEIHHVVHWANGGPTDRSNLAGLCRGHHHAVHERGFNLRGDPNMELEVVPP